MTGTGAATSLAADRGGTSRRCCLVSLTDIQRDPRICRHGDALHEAGWQVTALGAAGPADGPRFERLDWAVREAPLGRPSQAIWGRGWRVARVALAGRLVPATLALSRRFPYHRALLAAGRDITADVFIANDWQALPLAFALAERSPGAHVVYDSHELAAEERSELIAWRLLYGQLARATERRLIGRAAAVITVSEGIAEIIGRLYRLPCPPRVVRNLPPFVQAAFHEPDPRAIGVLYQGGLAPGRGIETLLESVPLWQGEYRLTVRGPGSADYLRELKARTERFGVSARVRFEEPCAPAEMIYRASAFDIGIHPLQAVNRSNRHALPNKLFEYIMAGLAVCVSDLPDMAGIVAAHQCGALIRGESAAAIAEAVNGLTVPAIAAAKRRSLAAAQELCWDREKRRLTSLLDEVCPLPRVAPKAIPRKVEALFRTGIAAKQRAGAVQRFRDKWNRSSRT